MLAGGRWGRRAGVGSMVHLPAENQQVEGLRGEWNGQGLSFPAHNFQHTASDPVSGCSGSRGD